MSVLDRVLQKKFDDLGGKFKSIFDHLKKYPKVFSESKINPNRGLQDQERVDLSKFLDKFCTEARIKSTSYDSCKAEVRSEDVELLNRALTLVRKGAVDLDAMIERHESYEQSQDRLINLLETAKDLVAYEKRNPELASMNKLVREFRDSALSLSKEFVELGKVKTESQLQVFSTDGTPKVSSACTDQFKAPEFLAAELRSNPSTSQYGQELTIYQPSEEVIIVNPEFDRSAKPGTTEADSNSRKAGFHAFKSHIGGLQVVYMNSFALPVLVKAACDLQHSTADSDDIFDDVDGLVQAENVMGNFLAIFNGLDSEYTDAITQAASLMSDVRWAGVGKWDYNQFVIGKNIIKNLVHAVAKQHSINDVAVTDDVCPAMKAVVLAGEQESDAVHENN